MPDILLDQYYMNLMQRLALTEGILSFPEDSKPMHFEIQADTNHGASKLLDTILLSSSIDTYFSGLKWDKFKQLGILKDDSSVLNGSNLEFENKEYRIYVFDKAFMIIGRNIVPLARKLNFLNGIRPLDDDHKIKEIDLEIRVKFLTYLFDVFRAEFLESGNLPKWGTTSDGFRNFISGTIDPILGSSIHHHAYHQLERTIIDLTFSFSQENNSGSHFLGVYPPIATDFAPRDPVARIIRLIRLEFNNRLSGLPRPRNLGEALEMRHDIRFVRLRRKIDEWMLFARGSSVDISQTINSDIAKAIREIEGVNKWKHRRKGSVSFWTTAIAGHIPVLSNAIAIGQSIETFVINKKTSMYGWVR